MQHKGKLKEKVFIFDFDGTIIDSIDDIVFILSKYIPNLTRNTLRQILVDVYIRHSTSALFKMFYAEILIFLHVNQVLKNIVEDTGKLPLIHDIQDVLIDLHKNGVKLFVVSSNFTKNIQDYLISKNLDVFERVEGIGIIFGKARYIKAIANTYSDSDIYYIGDDIRDVLAAKKACVKSVAVTWGLSTKEDFQYVDPDYIVDQPTDLLRI
ncbi:MAG: phosphoglycolate phosphatase [Candidatus Dojkabacteria bacterium]|nr:MAG: phosphoglycolate phosphatase [Candidatus Dojkabacteria bacterium]